MNGSQLLYKILDLQFNIRRKEIEYTNALKTKDQLNMDLNNAGPGALKEGLAITVKEFSSTPAPGSCHKPKNSKKNTMVAKPFQF